MLFCLKWIVVCKFFTILSAPVFSLGTSEYFYNYIESFKIQNEFISTGNMREIELQDLVKISQFYLGIDKW